MINQIENLSSNANKNLKINPDIVGNAEVEKNETILNQKGLFRVEGKNAKSHTNGGVPTILEEGDFVFSDKVKIKGKEIKPLFPWLNENKTYTMSDISKSGPLKNFNNHLNNLDSDYSLDKKTAELMTGNLMNKLSALSLVQESIKGMPNGLPDLSKMYLGNLEAISGTMNEALNSQDVFKTGGEKKRKINEPSIEDYPGNSIFNSGHYQYEGRPYVSLFDTGEISRDGVRPFIPLKTQSKGENGRYGQISEEDVTKQLSRYNDARLYTNNSVFDRNNALGFQNAYDEGFKTHTGMNYFDENSGSPYGRDGLWGQYSLSTPTWGMKLKGSKAGRIQFSDLVNGNITEDQLQNEWGVSKQDIVESYNQLGKANSGVSYIDFVQNSRQPVESIGVNPNLGLMTSQPNIQSPRPTMNVNQPSNLPTPSNTSTNPITQTNDTGYNMMEQLNALMSASALNMPNIYPKRYENYGIPQAMGLVQNESPIDLEAQKESVRQSAQSAYNANNALSTNSSQAAINNSQIAANSTNALNQIEGQEYNMNVQREDRRNSILQNLILNRGSDLMQNARQYNTEYDALRQNIYEDRLNALRGLTQTLQQNYNNKLQRNLTNSIYGDNMQMDAEGRVTLNKPTNINDKIEQAKNDPNQEQINELKTWAIEQAKGDPKGAAILMQQIFKNMFNPPKS